MKRVGSKPGAIWLQDILRQANGVSPQAKLDEIADSLVARAVSRGAANEKNTAYATAVDAINALALAGNRELSDGKPYAGAFDRLVTAHQHAVSRGVRRRALGGLLKTPYHTRAVNYLRGVAESSDSTSYEAVDLLNIDAIPGPDPGMQPTASQRESAAALDALAARRRITNILAKNLLEGWIAQQERRKHPSGVRR